MAVVAISVLSWPPVVAISTGLDPSWKLALHQAFSHGLSWGSDIVFSYGPLGFLSEATPFVGWTSGLALFFTACVYVVGVGTLLRYAVALLPVWVAVLVTLIIARIMVRIPVFELVEVLAFLWLIHVCINSRRRDWPVVVVALGILVAFLLIAKVSVGIAVGAMGAAAACRITTPWWRGMGAFLAAVPIAAVALWAASGQKVGDLPGYVVGSGEIVRGYSDAMGVTLFVEPLLLYLLFGATVALLAVGLVLAARPLSRPDRAAVIAIGVLFAFAVWKASFVRADGHAVYAFMAAAMVGMPLLATAAVARLRWPAIAVLVTTAAFTSGVALPTFLDLSGSVVSLVSQLGNSLLPGSQETAIAATRTELRRQYGLNDDVLAALVGKSVHIDPWETAIAVAYPELRWSPLPVFQTYAAFTPALDGLNADRLSGDAAPDRILRQAIHTIDPVDDRNPWYEAPAATLQMLCRYEEVATSVTWQVLSRTGRDCLAPEPLGRITAHVGEAVPVPEDRRQDRFVIVRISGLSDSPADLLQALVWRGREWTISLDGQREYRLVAATAAEGLLLAVPADLSFAAPFAFNGPKRTLEVGGRSLSGETLTFEFISVPLPARR